MTAPHPRPRVVTAAFWCWAVAAVLLLAFGLLLALSRNDVPTFVRGAGVLFVVAGLALAFLTGRTRAGHTELRRAAVGLALALAMLLAAFSLLGGGVIWLVIMILSVVGAVLVTRPVAQEWFDSKAPK